MAHLELVGQNRLQDPEIGGLVADCRDVTDHWHAAEELRNSERQYRLLFHGNPNPMWVFDLETQAFWKSTKRPFNIMVIRVKNF